MAPEQSICFLPFEKDSQLAQVLGLEAARFDMGSSLYQLGYISDYVKALGCESLAIESHYVDRDHMEDHSVFYSRSLQSFENFCKRVHFFSTSTADLQGRIQAIYDACKKQTVDDYRRMCKELAEEFYLGFSIIKPLRGSPVGRTVLRPQRSGVGKSQQRCFQSTRELEVHFAGIDLRIQGLPFQQQDVGVSACATTALWCSLHKARDLEEIVATTPAQITMLATQNSLPFGRAMPAEEGLSVSQMCQALQALGVSPFLLSPVSFVTARFYLYSAIRSGFAPVLILNNADHTGVWHAVTASGMQVTAKLPTRNYLVEGVFEASCLLTDVYVHDDRIGPYLPAKITGSNLRRQLELEIKRATWKVPENWILRYLLIPLHHKIRLSIDTLFQMSTFVVDQLIKLRGSGESKNLFATGEVPPPIVFDGWIVRTHGYLRQLLFEPGLPGSERAQGLYSSVPLPRYLGVIRASIGSDEWVDLLVDTTSTKRNPHCLAAIAGGESEECRLAARHLADAFGCRAIV